LNRFIPNAVQLFFGFRKSFIHASQRTIQNPAFTKDVDTNRSSADCNLSVRGSILAIVPSLRAFAISLSGNVDRADDLVQETLLRALATWLFTIERNVFRTGTASAGVKLRTATGGTLKR
jgi:hypothetical protein